MEDTAIQLRVITDRRTIELHRLTQGKTAVLFKHIDNLNAIGRRRERSPTVAALLLPGKPLLLLLLRQQHYGVTDRISRATMPSSCIRNQEQDRSLRCTHRLIPFTSQYTRKKG